MGGLVFWTFVWFKNEHRGMGTSNEPLRQINWQTATSSHHLRMRGVSLLVLCVSPACHMCPPLFLRALLFHVPRDSLYRYPCSQTQYPSWDTEPMTPRSSVPFSAFVTFIPVLFVRFTSVCMTYPKSSPTIEMEITPASQ